ncbi:MAG: hypothetical protein VYA51_04955 [Planctomycetota bacterium]|nr:hypothetical protein [Planctomycetota bacterium]
MESVDDIKEQLAARARTATLEELADQGRRRVRLIRAEHIAQMIADAVNHAVQDAGLLDPGQVDALVEKSRAEFHDAIREREEQLRVARVAEEQLEASEQELADVQARFAALSHELALARSELEQAHGELEAARQPADGAEAPQRGGTASPDSVRDMAAELAALKANVAQQGASTSGAPASSVDVAAALDKLARTLNERLDTFGKKLGVSAAVGGDAPVDFGGMFREDVDRELESNMGDIQTKQRAGGGIADNLAKLKKLKGGE